MVTVLYSDVKIRYFGIWPAGISDAAVTSICAHAEAVLTQRAGATGTLDLTTASAVQLSIDLVVMMIERALYGWASGAATGVNPPPLWNADMESRLQMLLQDTTSDGTDLIDSHTWTES